MPAPFCRWYLISMPSPGASLSSRESILYRLGWAVKTPGMTGASPFPEGSGLGLETEGSTGVAEPGTGFGGCAAADFERSVRPKAAPVPSASMPYSAGSTAVIKITPAIRLATTVAWAIFFFDGCSNVVDMVSWSIIA